jgi:hypothetical protein
MVQNGTVRSKADARFGYAFFRRKALGLSVLGGGVDIWRFSHWTD